MELALLVWGISMLPWLVTLFVVLAAISAVILFLLLFHNIEGALVTPNHIAWSAVITMCLVLVSIALPSKQTAYIMVGAYAAQQIVLDPKSQQIGAKTLQLIEQKLDEQLLKSTTAPTAK